VGVALAAIEMRQPALARAVPIAVGVVVLIAGALQFTAWKALSPRLLPGGTRTRPHAVGRRRHGLAARPAPRPPLQSVAVPVLMAILLVIGVMDLRAMAVVAAAITSNVSHRPVTASRAPSEGSSSWQGCF
jgi:hypothetical protein